MADDQNNCSSSSQEDSAAAANAAAAAAAGSARNRSSSRKGNKGQKNKRQTAETRGGNSRPGSSAQARVQMQIVSKLERQLAKERETLQAMLEHLSKQPNTNPQRTPSPDQQQPLLDTSHTSHGKGPEDYLANGNALGSSPVCSPTLPLSVNGGGLDEGSSLSACPLTCTTLPVASQDDSTFTPDPGVLDDQLLSFLAASASSNMPQLTPQLTDALLQQITEGLESLKAFPDHDPTTTVASDPLPVAMPITTSVLTQDYTQLPGISEEQLQAAWHQLLELKQIPGPGSYKVDVAAVNTPKK